MTRWLPLVIFSGLCLFAVSQLFSGRSPNDWQSVLIDRPAPASIGPTLSSLNQGQAESIDFLADKTRPKIVNFFASYCQPCILEHPQLIALQQGGYEIVGINWKDKQKDANKYLRRFGNPFETVVVDTEARIGIDWGVTGIPETFIVDRAGRVRYHHSGEITAIQLRDEILPILGALQ